MKATFDNFAPTFDEHLRAIGYQVPALMAAMLHTHLTAPADILDLGCGTGLVGAALHGNGHHLVGVDLSEKMLARARSRGAYERLHVDEVGAFLAQAPDRSADVVCAADVFIYIGALDALFAHAARVLRPGGLFTFSTEECTGDDFVLLPTGRYAQSEAYIRRLAGPLAILDARPVTVRMERDVPVAGRLYLLQKPRES